MAKKSEWASRIQLEALLHASTAFVTLTYNEDHVDPSGSLRPVDLQKWLKRIRERVEPLPLRFFACGEYGLSGSRPHYHVALFGYPYCARIESRFDKRGHCCPDCDRLLETWGMGFVHSTPLSAKGARYIAGYVTKKMTRKDDPRLQGRYPEFARQSNRPGIGADFMPAVARKIKEGLIEYELDDVPAALQQGRGQYLPLGKYLRRKLREELGWPPETPDHIVQEYQEKMRDLQAFAINNGTTAKALLVEMAEGKMNTIEFWERVRRKTKL